MNPQPVTSDIYVLENVYDSSAEQTIECDITLPDYCPDIQRILRCRVTPSISSAQVSGGRVAADGTAFVKIVYVGEDGRAAVYEQGVPFSKSFETPDADGACVRVRASVDYANCRAVSGRRAEIKAMTTVSCRVTSRRPRSVISGIDGEGIRLRSRSVNAVSAVCCRESSFPMSETVETDRSDAPISQVVSCTAAAVATDVRIISDKLLLKGDLLVTVCYLTEQADGARTLRHSMPISRVIEAPGITESCSAGLEMNVAGVRADVKNDGSGQPRLFDLEARVDAVVSAFSSSDIPVLTDAYATNGAIALERQSVRLNTLLDSFSDSFTASASLDLSPLGAQSILWVETGAVASECAVRDGELAVTGTVMLHIYYLDAEARTGYAEKPIDFEHRRSLRRSASDALCEPSITAVGSELRLNSDGSAAARVELAISALVFGEESDKIITGVSAAEDEGVRAAALTLYFPEAGEELWGIAKRYGTTVEAIMRENGLASETVPEKQMLLVPRCG